MCGFRLDPEGKADKEILDLLSLEFSETISANNFALWNAPQDYYIDEE